MNLKFCLENSEKTGESVVVFSKNDGDTRMFVLDNNVKDYILYLSYLKIAFSKNEVNEWAMVYRKNGLTFITIKKNNKFENIAYLGNNVISCPLEPSIMGFMKSNICLVMKSRFSSIYHRFAWGTGKILERTFLGYSVLLAKSLGIFMGIGVLLDLFLK